MGVFYVVPPRAILGERFARALNRVMPGLELEPADWCELADRICEIVARKPDVFVILGDDLPAAGQTVDELAAQIGAEAGDRILEIQASPEQEPLQLLA